MFSGIIDPRPVRGTMCCFNHGHGAAYNNLVLEQAADYFRDTCGRQDGSPAGTGADARTTHKSELNPTVSELSDSETKENGRLDIHARVQETSLMLFLRPDPVSPLYRTLASLTVNNRAYQFSIARTDGWLGYFGSPRNAAPLLRRKTSDVALRTHRPSGARHPSTASWTRDTSRATQAGCSRTKRYRLAIVVRQEVGKYEPRGKTEVAGGAH
jgi:hypothetical protein